MKDLSLIEELVLWAVLKLEGDAYGVTIRRKVSRAAGKNFPYGTLYSVLAKLTRMGYVRKVVGDPSPVRGGRSRNYYRISPGGREALRRTLTLRRRLWDEESQLALDGGGSK
jgi:DNA-binding PadR family transcriptional regulator